MKGKGFKMKYLLGVDLGTSGTKTVLFDTNGVAVASHTVEYPIIQPQNGWAEQDPADWWNAVKTTISAVVSQSNVCSDDIAGIGVSGQMHGLVLLDDAGKVLRNSIIWCDGRTGKQCKEITEKVGEKRLIEITANPALTGFTAGKILWVRENEPEIYEKTKHILLPKDYITYCLTGNYSTEVSDASGMNLLDMKTRDWSQEILDKLDIEKALLATVHESCAVTGNVSPTLAEQLGLSTKTVVVCGAGDNAAAAVGMGVCEKGNAFATIGTSGVVFAHVDDVSIDPQGRVHTFCAAVPNAYTVMSCTMSAGLSLKWFKENFCQNEIVVAKELETDTYQLMCDMAETSPIGANRLLYMPYLMGERSPILDEKARGGFIGLSAIHSKKDLIRSILEGVIYSQKHCLDILKDMNVAPETMLACGGGGTSPLWRQMMADVFDCPVTTSVNKEGPALGVAILAGVGAGLYPSVPEGCKQILKYSVPQNPNKENSEKYQQFYGIYKQLYPALKDSFHSLASL